MKRIFIVACMLTFALMVSAQGGQGGGQRQGGFQQTPEQRAARQEQMKKDLKLNDKQFADYKKLDEAYWKKVQAAREGGNVDREAMTKLRDEQTAAVKKILTADQFKKYEEIQAAQRQRGGQGGGNRQN